MKALTNKQKAMMKELIESGADRSRLLDYVRAKTKHEGPGRPPLSPAVRASVVLTFRVTESERRALEEAANERGVSVSDYIRRKVLPR